MGITLTSKTVSSTYDSLLKLSDNDQLTGAFKLITDGLGTDTGISINDSGDVNISGTLVVGERVNTPILQLTGGTGTQGTFSWNSNEWTVDLIQNGTTLQLGQEVQIHVKNQTGATIPDGTPVYATGTLGASGRITVAPMIADGSIEAKYFLGVTTEDIADGGDGKITTFGKIRGLNTSAYTEGQTLWVSSTVAGAFQTTRPLAPNLDLEVAIVINSHANNGIIFVRANNGHYLGTAHDVNISSVAENDLLVYKTNRWVNTKSIGDLSAANVTVSGYLRGPEVFVIDPAAHGNNEGLVQILGDLRVDGITTTINSTTISVSDKNITLAKDAVTAGDANGAGITIAGANATLTYLSASDDFTFNKNVNASRFVGPLTGNVTGTVSTLSNHDTDDLDEGATNLYFTTARARDSFSAGTGVTINAGEISIGQSVGTTDDVTFDVITATGGTSTEWNAAYDYSQVGHLPLTGGTLTGTLNGLGANFTDPVTIYDNSGSENPRLSVGRSDSERLSFDVEDRVAKIYHVQDEASGGHSIEFSINSPDPSKTFYWLGKAADATSPVTFMTLNSNGITATGYNKTNWDGAYDYSQIGHLPLTGGTLTGDLTLDDKLTITGTTNDFVIDEEADGTWHLYDTFQDNGIVLYSGSGGMDFQYNGVTEMTIDGSGVSFTGTINLDAADLNIGSADIIFGTTAGGATRGLIWDVSGSGFLSKLIGGGADGGKVTLFANMDDAITTGNIFEIKDGSTGSLFLGLSHAGILTAGGGTSTQWNTAYNYSQIGHLPLAGGTLTGKVTFPSAVSDRPQFPGGILGLNTGDGNFDIWGISTDYYPSHSTASNAWGLRWSGDNNEFQFVGSGSNRVVLDMDNGNITASGTITASGYNKSNWDTAYSYSQVGHLPLAGGDVTGTVTIGGKLGVGVTPSDWSLSGLSAMQIKNAGFYGYSTNEYGLTGNLYYNGGWKYIANGTAQLYVGVNGAHIWYTYASGTAGAAATQVQTMQLNTSGNLTVTGTLSATGGNSTNWNTAYGWGNHAGLYLPIGGKAADSELLDGYNLDGNVSVATRIFNNKGQAYGTYTDFNTAMTPGPNYLQGGTNGPTGTTSQWYGFMLGLGSQYNTETGNVDGYASQLYWNRQSAGGFPYLYARDLEAGTWGSWRKMGAGYADTAGSALVADASNTASYATTAGTASNADYASNSNLLDSLDSTQFLRSDEQDVMTGDGAANTYRGVLRINNTGTYKWGGIAFPDDVNAADSAKNNYYFIGRGDLISDRVMSFHIPTGGNYESGIQPKFVFASTGADQLMTIQATTGNVFVKGNLGIGTTNPISGLSTPLTLEDSVNGYVGISLRGTGLYENTWQMYASGDGGSTKFFGLYDRTNSAYRFVATNSGNIGIGTTSPGQKLHVDGSVLFNGGTGASTFNDVNIGGISGWSTNEAHRINFVYGSASSPNIFQTIESHFDGNTSRLRFRNLFNANNPSTDISMTILGNGNVGIGIDTPTYPLDLGNGGTGNSIRARRIWANGTGTDSGFSLNNTLIYEDSSNRFLITNPGSYPSTAFCINTSGNVGINTTNPSGKFDIAYDMYTGAGTSVLQAGAYGNINFKGASSQGTTTTQQGITWQVDSYAGGVNYGVQAQIAVGNNGNVGTFMGFFTSDNYGLPPVERVRIQHNGHVGIGTNAPSNKLDVVGATNTDVVTRLKSNGTAAPYFRVDMSLVSYGGLAFDYNSVNKWYIGAINGDINNRLSIYSAGGVGRTHFTSGGSLLHGDTTVPGESVWKGTAVFGQGGNDKVITGYLTSGTNGAIIGGHTSALTAWAPLTIAGTELRFNYGETRVMTMTNIGLGIGTTTPVAKLHVGFNGENGSGGLSQYAIVATANIGQATIGCVHDGDGYANLNLGSNEGGNKRFWHISKRLAEDSHRLEYYYYTTESSFASRFAFMTNGDFHADGDVIAYSSTISDQRLKDDVKTIDNALDKVKAMRGVEYVWNEGSRKGQKDLGLIAQEVEQVLPEIVREKETIYHGEEGKYKTVDYEKIVGVLIEAIKEQQQQIDELKSLLNGITK